MATYNLGQAAVVSRGAYSSSVAYKQLNTVTHRRGTFMCIADCSNIEPGVSTNWRNYWVMTAAGIYDVDVSATSTTVTMTMTLSDGTTEAFTYTATAVAAGAVRNEQIGEAISIANGGTGATTAAAALANLGITLPLPVASGGTGGADAETARAGIVAQKQVSYYVVAVSGSASTWTLTKDVNNNNLSEVKAGSAIWVSPSDDSSWTSFRNYGVRLSSQAVGSLTFNAESTVPAGTTMTINVAVFN